MKKILCHQIPGGLSALGEIFDRRLNLASAKRHVPTKRAATGGCPYQIPAMLRTWLGEEIQTAKEELLTTD